MPRIRGSVSVEANSRSGNVLDGEDYEFISTPALVAILAGSSAASLNADFKINSEQLVDEGLVNVVAAAGRLIGPDDLLLDRTLIAPGRLGLEFINDTAGALTAFWDVEVDFQGARALGA